MMTSYTSNELTKEARAACKGVGRYHAWTIEISPDGPVYLKVYYVSNGSEGHCPQAVGTVNVAI